MSIIVKTLVVIFLFAAVYRAEKVHKKQPEDYFALVTFVFLGITVVLVTVAFVHQRIAFGENTLDYGLRLSFGLVFYGALLALVNNFRLERLRLVNWLLRMKSSGWQPLAKAAFNSPFRTFVVFAVALIDLSICVRRTNSNFELRLAQEQKSSTFNKVHV